jgi:hypothetical protein
VVNELRACARYAGMCQAHTLSLSLSERERESARGGGGGGRERETAKERESLHFVSLSLCCAVCMIGCIFKKSKFHVELRAPLMTSGADGRRTEACVLHVAWASSLLPPPPPPPDTQRHYPQKARMERLSKRRRVLVAVVQMEWSGCDASRVCTGARKAILKAWTRALCRTWPG